MAIELEKLLFSVDTAELDTALKKIGALSEKLDTLTTATNKTNKASNDSTKTLKNSTTETNNATDAQNQLNESTSKANAILERQKDILKFQTEGFSKGQSSVLAYAKATGAATGEIKELGNVLQMQRKLIGGDPFDKSISGLVALQNQYGEIREAMRQYSKDTELTRNQTRELTRDKERIIEKMKLEGATFSQIKSAIKAHNDEYIRTANLVNNLTNQEKMLERAQKDKLNALRSIQAAEERVRATLVALNAETEDSTKLNERAALAAGAYERNLRVAGISADEAAKRLKNFNEQQAEVTKATQRNQMEYLARGIGVQVGDMGVSLASGMNPLTVAIQQFDQIRGLIQQTGATTQEMDAVMSKAVAQIVSSFKLLGVTVGSFVTGAIKSLGEYATTWTGVNKALQLAQDNMLITEATSMRLNKAISTVLAGSLGVIITLSAAFVIASKQMLDANNALDRSLAQFGATLGITSKEAHALAQSQTELGVTSATATNALADFAKSGITDVGMLEAALQSAIKTQKILGVSTEDTAKVFADLRKKPTETLIEIAKNTGLVNAETIKYVHTLEEQGKTQEAVAIAQGAVLASMEGVRQVADVNLTEVEKLWRDVKNAISETWGAMQNLSQNTDFWKGVRTAFAALKDVIQRSVIGIQGIALLLGKIFSGSFDEVGTVVDFITEKAKASADEFNNTYQQIWNTTEQNAKAEKKAAVERQNNAVVASKLAEQFKKEKESQNKAEKEAARILKEYNKDLDEFSKLIAEAYGYQERLTKSEMKMMEIIRSDYWNKYTEKQKIAILQAYDLAKATELATDKIKAQADSMRAWAEVTKEFQQQNAEMQKRNEVIDNEVQLLGLVGVEREKVLRQIELQNKYAAAQERFDKNQINIIKKYREEQEKASKLTSEENRDALYAQNAAAYEDAMTQAEELLNKERDVANKEVNKSIAESYYKEMQRVSDMLTDVLITALTEGGKAGSKKLGDYIKKELLNASSMFISSIIRAQLGNFMQSAFGINAGNYQGGTLAGNLVGKGPMPTGGSLLGSAITGVGNLVGSTGMASFGTGMGLSAAEAAAASAAYSSAGMGGVASSLQAGSMLGAAMPWISGGLMVASLLGGDMFSSSGAPKSMIGGGGRISAGKASYDPTGQMHWTDYTSQDNNLATSIISDQLVKALKKINSSYSAGAFVKGEINVKGSSSNQMLASATNEAGNLIYHFFQETGKGIEDFNKFIQEQVPKVQLALIIDAMRSSGEDYKEIANLIVGDSEDLTNALKDVSQEGIAAMQSSLSSAMQAFEIASNMFEEIGVKVSGQDFNKVAEATGGFDNLSSLLVSYYNNFYSEEEKRIKTMRGLVEELNSVGISITTEDALEYSKQDFRNLYESIVSVQGIASPAAIALLKVSRAFAEVSKEGTSVTDSLKDVTDSLKDVMQSLKDSVNVTKEEISSLYNTAIETEKKKLDATKESFSQIKSAISSIDSAIQSIGYFKQFSTNASTSGTLQDVASIIKTSSGTSFEDFEKIAGTTYNALQNVKTEAHAQLNLAENQVKLLSEVIASLETTKEEQLIKLDELVSTYQKQIDAINGITDSVVSVRDAVEAVEVAISGANKKDSTVTTDATPKAKDRYYAINPQVIEQSISGVVDITKSTSILGTTTQEVSKSIIEAVEKTNDLIRVVNERISLMQQEWQLLGDTKSIRKQELAQIDESNRAIQERIWKLQDEQSATDFIKPFKEFNEQFGNSQAVNNFRQVNQQFKDAQENLIKLGQLTIKNTELLNSWLKNQISNIESSVLQGFNIQDGSYASRVSSIKDIAAKAVKDLEAIGRATTENLDKISKWVNFQIESAAAEEAQSTFRTVESSFNNLVSAIQKSIQELEKTSNATDIAFEKLSYSVNQRKNILTKELDILKQSKSEMTSLIESITNAIRSLRKEVQPTNKMFIETARNLLGNAMLGSSVDNKELLDAVGTITEDVQSTIYQSLADQQRAYITLSNDLEILNKSNKESLSSTEQQILLAEDQIKALDDIVTKAKEQIESIRGVDSSILSVEQAIINLNEAIIEEEKTKLQIGLLNYQITLLTQQYEQAKLQYEETQGIRSDIQGLTKIFLDSLKSFNDFKNNPGSYTAPVTSSSPDVNFDIKRGIDAYTLSQVAAKSGADLSGLKYIEKLYLKEATTNAVDYYYNNPDWFLKLIEDMKTFGEGGIKQRLQNTYGADLSNVPAYAEGGTYRGGLALVGEQGPELINFNKPGMVYNANQTASILSGDSSLADKVEKLANAVEMLRYEARATAVNTSKMAKQLDRTSDQGDTLRVTVVT